MPRFNPRLRNSGRAFSELRSIALHGGNLELDADGYSSLDLCTLADACRQGGGRIRLTNSRQLRGHDCARIAKNAPGQVTFEF